MITIAQRRLAGVGLPAERRQVDGRPGREIEPVSVGDGSQDRGAVQARGPDPATKGDDHGAQRRFPRCRPVVIPDRVGQRLARDAPARFHSHPGERNLGPPAVEVRPLQASRRREDVQSTAQRDLQRARIVVRRCSHRGAILTTPRSPRCARVARPWDPARPVPPHLGSGAHVDDAGRTGRCHLIA